MWYVYILKCSDGTYYTGITNNLPRRLKLHALGTASKYTRCRLPVELAYFEKAIDRSKATQKEVALKKLSRSEKEKIIGLIKDI